jgi:hypothetical protein
MRPSILIAAVAGTWFAFNQMPLAHARTIEAECQMLFDKADENDDGALANGEANPFAEPMDGASLLAKLAATVSEEEFLVACGANVLQHMLSNQLA